MARLELRKTELGPRYFLDDHPLQNGDSIEVETNHVVSNSGRLRGQFLWTGEVGDQPYIRSEQFGLIISTDAVVHRVVLKPITPPAKRRAAKTNGKATGKAKGKRRPKR